MDIDEFLRALRHRMTQRADDLDGGVLAPDWVAAMTLDQIGEEFERLNGDWDIALAHGQPVGHGDNGVCPVDGERLPCRVLRDLAAAYGV